MLRRLLAPSLALAVTAALLAPQAPSAEAGGLAAGLRGPALEQALKTKRLKKIEWKELTLKDAVTWLRVATGWNFVVNQAALAKANVDTGTLAFSADFDDVALATLLDVLLEPVGLAVRIQDNLIWLTSKADAWGKLLTRLYGISHITWQKIDFIAPDINLKPSGFTGEEYEPERLVEDDPLLSGDAVADLLKELVEPGAWQTDGWTLKATKDYLVIRVPAKVHAKIPRALAVISAMK